MIKTDCVPLWGKFVTCHRDSRIVIPNDIIIGNLNKKKKQKKNRWSAAACQRRYRSIVPHQELQLQKTRKTCDQIRVKAEGGIRESRREGDKERSWRGTEKYKLRAPGTVLVAVLTFVACLQEIPQLLQPRAIVGAL